MDQKDIASSDVFVVIDRQLAVTKFPAAEVSQSCPIMTGYFFGQIQRAATRKEFDLSHFNKLIGTEKHNPDHEPGPYETRCPTRART